MAFPENTVEIPDSQLFAGLKGSGEATGIYLAIVDGKGQVSDLVFLQTVQDAIRYLRQLKAQLAGLATERGREPSTVHTLRGEFPGIPVCETQAASNQDHLLTQDVVLPISLLQGAPLRLHHAEFLDAILCAASARQYAMKLRQSPAEPGAASQFYRLKDPFRDYTLCIVTRHDRILLGMKKRGLGQGYWNGFGGKLEGRETPFEAAERELHEESSLFEPLLEPAGMLYFTFAEEIHPVRGFVFRVNAFQGEPAESEEMLPQWFPVHAIPYERMWADDIFWLPLLLEGRPFTASFHVETDQSISRRSLVEMPSVRALFTDYGK